MSEPGRASSSLRLTSSHCGFAPGRVRWRAKPPRSFSPCRTNTACPRSSASGHGTRPPCSYVPRSQTITPPLPSGPSKSLCEQSWSATCTARRFAAGSSDGPFGTAHERITPSTSSRTSKWCAVAACSWTTKTPAGTPRIANCSWPSTFAALDGDVVDARDAAARAQEGDELLDRRRLALGVRPDRVIAVAHPAEHAERVRPLDRRRAQPDALDVAGDEDADGGAGHAAIVPCRAAARVRRRRSTAAR